MKYNLGYLFDLLVVITNKDLKVRYKSSMLGYLWSVANPLLFAMIYYFIFKLVMRVQIPNYTVFLITGLFPWQWFASSATNSLFSFIANAQIIKKTVFPRSVIPLSNVMMEGLHFLCTIPVIVVFLFVYGMTPSLSWVWGIPLIAIGQVIFTFGVSIIFSTLILYASDMIPEKFSWIITYNPLASMILSWRDLFMNGTLNYEYISILYFTGIILTVVGLSIFNKLKYRFAEIL